MEQGKQIGITPVAGGNGYIVSRDLSPRLVSVAGLKQLGRGARKHPAEQLRKLAESLKQFGFVLPILTGSGGHVVAGWALVLAARQLGLAEVPAVSLKDLSEAELRSLRLALNRLTEDSSWDRKELALELSEIQLLAPHLELEITGFEIGEIEGIMDRGVPDTEDELPLIDAAAAPVTRSGDLLLLGEHRLLCADPSSAESFDLLLGMEKAAMVFGDASCALAINAHQSGFGAINHDDSAEDFIFLKIVLGHAARCSTHGAIHFLCTPWQHMKEVIIAGEKIYGGLKDVCGCILEKSNAGTGLLYRPQFELVLVFKAGEGPHVNNMARRRKGRQRTNVWDYASQTGLIKTAKSKLGPDAGGKPVNMIADAISDCSDPGARILDPFGGAGATLIAAERTGRRAGVIEHDPILVDLCIERWQRLTGGIARHAETGRPFPGSGKAGRA